jgi:G3E family GTPase
MGKPILNVISGFLGAGKTSLISKMIDSNPLNEHISICVNEFAVNGVDGVIFKGKLSDVRELTSGCVCCTLKKMLAASIVDLIINTKFDRLFIEPSGIAKLSEVLDAVNLRVARERMEMGKVVTVVDIAGFSDNMRNYEEIFADQIKYAEVIVLSKTQGATHSYIESICGEIRKINPEARIIKSVWDDTFIAQFYREEFYLSGKMIESIKAGIAQNACGIKKVMRDISINVELPISEDAARKLVREICGVEGNDIARIKGLISDETGKTMKIDYVQGVISVEKVDLQANNNLIIIGKNIKYSEILDKVRNAGA